MSMAGVSPVKTKGSFRVSRVHVDLSRRVAKEPGRSGFGSELGCGLKSEWHKGRVVKQGRGEQHQWHEGVIPGGT